MDFFGIGFGEILLILVVILIVVGPTKIAGVAKDLGKIVNNLRKASSEVKAQLSRPQKRKKKRRRPPVRLQKARRISPPGRLIRIVRIRPYEP